MEKTDSAGWNTLVGKISRLFGSGKSETLSSLVTWEQLSVSANFGEFVEDAFMYSFVKH